MSVTNKEKNPFKEESKWVGEYNTYDTNKIIPKKKKARLELTGKNAYDLSKVKFIKK